MHTVTIHELVFLLSSTLTFPPSSLSPPLRCSSPARRPPGSPTAAMYSSYYSSYSALSSGDTRAYLLRQSALLLLSRRYGFSLPAGAARSCGGSYCRPLGRGVCCGRQGLAVVCADRGRRFPQENGGICEACGAGVGVGEGCGDGRYFLDCEWRECERGLEFCGQGRIREERFLCGDYDRRREDLRDGEVDWPRSRFEGRPGRWRGDIGYEVDRCRNRTRRRYQDPCRSARHEDDYDVCRHRDDRAARYGHPRERIMNEREHGHDVHRHWGTQERYRDPDWRDEGKQGVKWRSDGRRERYEDSDWRKDSMYDADLQWDERRQRNKDLGWRRRDESEYGVDWRREERRRKFEVDDRRRRDEDDYELDLYRKERPRRYSHRDRFREDEIDYVNREHDQRRQKYTTVDHRRSLESDEFVDRCIDEDVRRHGSSNCRRNEDSFYANRFDGNDISRYKYSDQRTNEEDYQKHRRNRQETSESEADHLNEESHRSRLYNERRRNDHVMSRHQDDADHIFVGANGRRRDNIDYELDRYRDEEDHKIKVSSQQKRRESNYMVDRYHDDEVYRHRDFDRRRKGEFEYEEDGYDEGRSNQRNNSSHGYYQTSEARRSEHDLSRVSHKLYPRSEEPRNDPSSLSNSAHTQREKYDEYGEQDASRRMHSSKDDDRVRKEDRRNSRVRFHDSVNWQREHQDERAYDQREGRHASSRDDYYIHEEEDGNNKSFARKIRDSTERVQNIRIIEEDNTNKASSSKITQAVVQNTNNDQRVDEKDDVRKSTQNFIGHSDLRNNHTTQVLQNNQDARMDSSENRYSAKNSTQITTGNSSTVNQQYMRMENNENKSTQIINDNRITINQQTEGTQHITGYTVTKEALEKLKDTSEVIINSNMDRRSELISDARNNSRNERYSDSKELDQRDNRLVLVQNSVQSAMGGRQTNQSLESNQQFVELRDKRKNSEKVSEIYMERNNKFSRTSQSQSSYAEMNEEEYSDTSVQNLTRITRDKKRIVNLQEINETDVEEQNISHLNLTRLTANASERAQSSASYLDSRSGGDQGYSTDVVNLASDVGRERAAGQNYNPSVERDGAMSTGCSDSRANVMSSQTQMSILPLYDRNEQEAAGVVQFAPEFSSSTENQTQSRYALEETQSKVSQGQLRSELSSSSIIRDDRLESAAQLDRSTVSYVGEFMDKLHEETLMSSTTASSRHGKPLKEDNSKSSSRAAIKGPSDEIWDVKSGTSQETYDTADPEEQLSSAGAISSAAQTPKTELALARRSNKPLWAFIADIIRLGWLRPSGSHESPSLAGKKQSSSSSLSTEGFLLSQEHKNDDNGKNSRPESYSGTPDVRRSQSINIPNLGYKTAKSTAAQSSKLESDDFGRSHVRKSASDEQVLGGKVSTSLLGLPSESEYAIMVEHENSSRNDIEGTIASGDIKDCHVSTSGDDNANIGQKLALNDVNLDSSVLPVLASAGVPGSSPADLPLTDPVGGGAASSMFASASLAIGTAASSVSIGTAATALAELSPRVSLEVPLTGSVELPVVASVGLPPRDSVDLVLPTSSSIEVPSSSSHKHDTDESSEIGRIGESELKQRRLQRTRPVSKDTFDDWEEAHKREDAQRKVDEIFMREALEEAHRAADAWEVPVGAVLVQNGQVIARGCNLVEDMRDSTAHAEMVCIKEASNQLRTWRLAGTTLYVTLEPCAMCAGAILQARIDTVVWGAPNKLLGADGSWVRLFPGDGESSSADPPSQAVGPVHPFHPKITIRRGILAAECSEVMQQFFQLRRKKQNRTEQAAAPRHQRPSFFSKVHNLFLAMLCV